MTLEEINRPHPKCLYCDMCFSWISLNIWHSATTLCTRGSEQNLKILAEEEAQEEDEVTLKAYGQTLVILSYFRYLGQTLMAVDNNFPAVFTNLWKERKVWDCLLKILGRK